MAQDSNAFGQKLRTLRVEAGFDTQEAAAAALRSRGVKVSARSVGMYETGRAKPPYKTLHAIAGLYGASYSQLSLLAADGAR